MTEIEQISNNKKINNLVLPFSICLFVLSLIMPCYNTEHRDSGIGEGLSLLFVGLIGLPVGGACLSWFANPLLFISWGYFTKKPNVSLILSFIALVFCLLFQAFKNIMVDEAGHYEAITKIQIGYWMWTLSAFVLFIGNVIRYTIEKRSAS